jgi:succinate-semialdehyde dehydrogenase/glutarate-semialdehyde dehydrogenase
MPQTLDLYLAGEWTHGTGDRHHRLVSPVTGEHIADVPIASSDDIDRAVAAARAAQEDFRFWSPFERADLLHRIATAIETMVPEIARIQTLEQGKPYHAESLADIAEANQYFLNAAEDVKRLSGETIPTTDRNKRMFTFHRPVGVWAAITPWNFPVTIPLEYLGPGLATGNAVIAKPPEFTCWALLELARAFDEAGLPKGLVSIIPGAGDIGSSLVQHPGVDAIGFTGSSATGRKIIASMGIKRSIMEMSGNGPTIVTDDADAAAAARAAVYGAYYNAGQVCCATERVIVTEAIRDEFVELALKAAGDAVLGDPFDEATTMGPVNNEPGAAKMDAHVADAVDRGATVVTGGSRAGGYPTSLYWEPTVLNDVPPESIAVTQETFGPIAPVVGVSSLEDAIRQTNSQTYGLMAAIFTADLSAGMRYADSVGMGLVNINETTNYWEAHLPWGGRASSQSGIGRVGGAHVMDTLTELQTVLFKA